MPSLSTYKLLMSNLVLQILAASAQQAKAHFVSQARQIERVQANFLRSLLQTHQNTVFGREYCLSEVKTIDKFRDRVPVQPYSQFAAYTQRMVDGEANVLTASPVIFFNITSGSTGRHKFIPVTQQSWRFLSRSRRAAMGFLVEAAQRTHRPLGKMLYSSSILSHGHTATGIAYTSVSTNNVRLSNVFSRQLFANPFEVFQVTDTQARSYLCLLFALRNANLRIICTTFPVVAMQICGFLEQWSDSLIQDIAIGEIAPWLKLEPELRVKLERQWAAHPQRAAQLQACLRATGRLTPQTAWPDLSFLIAARGGTSDFYFERFPDYFGNIPIFGGTYSSTEGVLGVHHNFNTDSAVLAIESGFFEFIPEDQWDVEFPKTLLPWEVKSGDRYRIVFTNYNGFYRYDLEDIVTIDGFFEQTPLLLFQHRCGNVISASTEKTTEAHAVRTLQILQQRFNVLLENFCITLSKDCIPSHYLVNIELAAGSTLSDPEEFLQQFDNTMKELQIGYAVKRRDQIPSPRLRILAPGSFESLRQRLMQRGVAEAQLKFPHVTENRNFLDNLTITQEIHLPTN